MIEIIPAVLPERYGDIESKAALVAGITKFLQIDLVDGRFVNNRTWPYNGKDAAMYEAVLHEEAGLPQWEKLNFEIDAMVKDPVTDFEIFVKMGASRVVFHIESMDIASWLMFFERMDPYFKENIELGMAINTTTDVALLEPLLSHVKFIQCMGIEHIGFQKQPHDPRVLEQISKVRALSAEIIIAVDGAVNLETAPELVAAGATRLVVGSALFQDDDIRGTIEAFKRVCNQKDSN